MPGIKLCDWSGRFPGAVSRCLICCAICLGQAEAQTAHAGGSQEPGVTNVEPPAGAAADANPITKRILGIFPNYGTSPSLSPYVPISSKEKFKIAGENAFDPGAFALAAAGAGVAQFGNSNRVFGQEIAGYSRYFVAAYANHVVGDFLTGAVYPSLLHQDPRYFRKGSGSVGSRVSYAISRVFRTQTDAGGTTVNYSRLLGTASTVAVSNLYYADRRDAPDAAIAFSGRLGAAMAANVVKEFWPDLLGKFSKKH